MKLEQNWFAVDVSLTPPAVEAVEYALSEAGTSGTEYSTLGIKEIREIVSVVGYFDEMPDLEIIKSEIENSLIIYNLPSDSVKEISAREVENKDWLAEWKKNWRPTETEKFIIAPVWSEVETGDKIIIRIEPSMAFGTGTHETTRLCLKAIEENYKGESFFDVGTGTGILAIAVAKLKSKVQSLKSKVKDSEFPTLDSGLSTLDSILACDTDEDSIKIAEENAELNDVQGIEFYVGSIDENTPKFDFVCANLTADVIVPLLPLLVEKFGKILLLSGILKEQEEWVAGELRKLRITNYELRTDGEWISVLIKNLKEN
jgi:ribosomal protein L11 methyltransferase